MNVIQQQVGTIGDPKAKTLVAKLAEACDAVGGVAKKGRNDTQKYDYVKAADVAKAIRHELFSRGIIVMPHETAVEYVEIPTNSGGKMTECRLTTEFHITDGKETIKFQAYSAARDSGDKSPYKAKTGALKYFLRGLGLIPDEVDDPEFDGHPGKPSTEEYEEAFIQREAAQPKVERIAAFQVKALHDAMAKTGKTEANVMERLGRAGCKQFEQVPKADFNDLLKWMMAPTNPPADLTETLQKSVEAAKEAKPPADGRTIKMKRMFAITKKKGIPEADLRQMAKEVYGRDSLTELLIPEIEGITEWADQFVMP